VDQRGGRENHRENADHAKYPELGGVPHRPVMAYHGKVS
jgi:hypothetical protein